MVAAALSQPIIPMETASSATVSALTNTTNTANGGGAARKRRRQILSSQRRKAADESSQNQSQTSSSESETTLPKNKKQCVASVSAPAPAVTATASDSAVMSLSSIPLALPDISLSTSSDLLDMSIELMPKVDVSDAVPSLVLSAAPRKVSDAGAASPIANSTTTISRAKKSTATTPKPKPKRPQMRYEPDVPMTKEEAAVWRREQRRKRNRESAAASRQRQRDRIAELEDEVDDWKQKFEAAMQRLKQLEQAQGITSSGVGVALPLASSPVSPCPSPELTTSSTMIIPSVPATTVPKAEMELQDATEKELLGPALTKGFEKNGNTNTSNNMELHLKEKISRPA